MITVYVTCGNSDDKLSQNEWADFVGDVRGSLREFVQVTHGEWFSAGDSPWQNCCWCVELAPGRVEHLQNRLRTVARMYGLGSIAWAEAPNVEMLG